MLEDNLARVYIDIGDPQQGLRYARAALDDELRQGRAIHALTSRANVARAESALGNHAVAAREIQNKRFAASGTHCNASMSEGQLQKHCKVDSDADALLKNAVDVLGFSARSYSRILKVARTIADLDNSETISSLHVSEAIQYRNLDRYKTL